MLCLAFVLSMAPAMAVAEGEGGECPHENWYNYFIPWEDVTYEPVDNAYHIAPARSYSKSTARTVCKVFITYFVKYWPALFCNHHFLTLMCSSGAGVLREHDR